MSLFGHLLLPRVTNNQRARLLHPSSLSVIVGLFVLFQLALGKLSQEFPQILGYAAQISPTEIVKLTNDRRQESGLSTLHLNPALSQAAARKAADMFAKGYWAHVAPDGTQPWYFITDSGYHYRFAGENLARDFSEAGSIVQAWMDSPSHRDNLLNDRYSDIGVAVVDGQLDGRETTLVVQMFGSPLAQEGETGGGTTALVPTVRAAESSPLPSPMLPTPSPETTPLDTPLPSTPVTSLVASTTPFDLTRGVSVALVGVFIVVLVIDIVSIHRRKITRWTSKSMAHLAFMLFLLVAAVLVNRGVIL